MSKPTFINSTVVYNDHSTEYNIDARGNKDIDALIRACKAEDIEPQPVQTPQKETKKDLDDIIEFPKKNEYSQVREYIKERSRFDAEFKERVESYSRVELCMYLTDLFGWDVDPHHLGVNMNRHH